MVVASYVEPGLFGQPTGKGLFFAAHFWHTMLFAKTRRRKDAKESKGYFSFFASRLCVSAPLRETFLVAAVAALGPSCLVVHFSDAAIVKV